MSVHGTVGRHLLLRAQASGLVPQQFVIWDLSDTPLDYELRAIVKQLVPFAAIKGLALQSARPAEDVSDHAADRKRRAELFFNPGGVHYRNPRSRKAWLMIKAEAVCVLDPEILSAAIARRFSNIRFGYILVVLVILAAIVLATIGHVVTLVTKSGMSPLTALSLLAAVCASTLAVLVFAADSWNSMCLKKACAVWVAIAPDEKRTPVRYLLWQALFALYRHESTRSYNWLRRLDEGVSRGLPAFLLREIRRRPHLEREQLLSLLEAEIDQEPDPGTVRSLQGYTAIVAVCRKRQSGD